MRRRQRGCPTDAQFDNDTRFQGSHAHPDGLGQVIRFCLSLGVTPVFAPPREHGPQNLHESFNHLWQQKVWQRFHHASVPAFQATSDRFVAAYRQRRATRDDQAPPRRAFPKRWRLDWQQRPSGTVIYLRRTNPEGAIQVLGHRWAVDRLWVNRLVRVKVDLRPIKSAATVSPAHTGGSTTGQNFQMCVSAQALSSRLTNIRWHLPIYGWFSAIFRVRSLGVLALPRRRIAGILS
jgi:hypothetical protein